VALLASAFGFDLAASDAILLNGARCCFLPPERKQALVDEFRGQMAALKADHLPDSKQQGTDEEAARPSG
jgi:hypothetical protein